ncbi:MAG: hypothetical protein IV090_07590 [Candidatus Sericytochromatia bacterium]|jgi:hypothetical protein|nr:hypothetical protein [Candidatus Sericytochromatia bacterium]
MPGSVSHTHVRSLFSLEREIEIDLLHIPTGSRSGKRPQPAPPQPDLGPKDHLQLSEDVPTEIQRLQFPPH